MGFIPRPVQHVDSITQMLLAVGDEEGVSTIIALLLHRAQLATNNVTAAVLLARFVKETKVSGWMSSPWTRLKNTREILKSTRVF